MEFFTADLHFYHVNAIRYFKRPFSSVEEMNGAMIRNWNQIVKAEDEVFILGDFTMRGEGYPDKILSQLRGRKYLVAGNHDYFAGSYEGGRLEWIKDYCELESGQEMFVLFHYPIADWNRKSHGAYHLHGHEHGDFRYNLRQAAEGTRRYDVGVDANNFTPVSRNAILRFFKDSGDGSKKGKGRRGRDSLQNDSDKE